MADNETTGTGKAVATDKVTYSGDADQNLQLVRIVTTTGAEGSKTVVDLPGDATNGLDVDVTRVQGSVAIIGPDTAGNPIATTKPLILGAVGVSSAPSPVDSGDAVHLASDLNGRLAVCDMGGSITVDNAGTFAVQVDGAALTALQLIDDPVFADDAAFTVGTSKVKMSGVLCVAHGSAPDAADALDAGAPLANRHRVPFVIGGHPNVISYTHTAITTAVTDSALITVSAGTKIVVTGITVTLDNASTVFPSVRIGFGTANVPALGNAGVLLAHGGLPAGGGVSRGDGSGILGVGADNEDLRITTVGNATGNGIQVTVTYHLIES